MQWLVSTSLPSTLPANAAVDIATDGTITTSVNGAKPQKAGRLKLVTPEVPGTPLVRGSDGLFRAGDGADLPNDPKAQVQGGALEGSNVNVVEALVDMISLARQFETHMKLLQNAQGNAQKAGSLLSMSG